MTRRRENFRESPTEKLHYALRDNRTLIGLVLAFLALAGLFVAIELWAERVQSLPAKEEEGEIVRFGASQGRIRPGDSLLVVVRTEGGRLQTVGASFARLSRCQAGDRIRLIRHGEMLRVGSPACPSPSRRPGGPRPP